MIFDFFRFALYQKKYEYQGGNFFGHHWDNSKLPRFGDQPISKVFLEILRKDF